MGGDVHIKNKSDTLNIYVPHEWAVVTSVARKNLYVVDIFETNVVKDYKRLQQELKINNVKKNTQGHTVHWNSGQGSSSNDVVSCFYRKEQPGKIALTMMKPNHLENF